MILICLEAISYFLFYDTVKDRENLDLKIPNEGLSGVWSHLMLMQGIMHRDLWCFLGGGVDIPSNPIMLLCGWGTLKEEQRGLLAGGAC